MAEWCLFWVQVWPLFQRAADSFQIHSRFHLPPVTSHNVHHLGQNLHKKQEQVGQKRTPINAPPLHSSVTICLAVLCSCFSSIGLLASNMNPFGSIRKFVWCMDTVSRCGVFSLDAKSSSWAAKLFAKLNYVAGRRWCRPRNRIFA